MRFINFVAMAAVAVPCMGQTKPVVQVFSARDVDLSWCRLPKPPNDRWERRCSVGDYPSHSIRLSVRTSSGGAEAHAHYDDIFVVTRGQRHPHYGRRVENAQTAAMVRQKARHPKWPVTDDREGRHVHIPAGTPHQLIIAPEVSSARSW